MRVRTIFEPPILGATLAAKRNRPQAGQLLRVAFQADGGHGYSGLRRGWWPILTEARSSLLTQQRLRPDCSVEYHSVRLCCRLQARIRLALRLHNNPIHRHQGEFYAA